MTEADYIRYFEQLAERHVHLRHTASQPHFFYNDDDTMSAVEQAVRSKLHLPCLVLDSYSDTLLTENDNFRTVVVGGFSVLCKTVAGDSVSRRQARQQARDIGLALVKRFRRDCLTPTGTLYLRKAKPDLDFEGNAVKLGESAVGWAYEIRLTLPATVQVESDEWTDLD